MRMNSSDVQDLSVEQLGYLLRRGAAGSRADQAAVDLLIEHDVWMRRFDFRRACVRVTDPEAVTPDYPAVAVIDWGAAADGAGGVFVGASSEVALLRVACSLGGADAVVLRDCLSRLDATNASLVARAMAYVLDGR